MERVNTVKEIKKLIDPVILPGYHYKTNFNCAEFLITIESHLVIAAKPVCTDTNFYYEFILDTQFLSKKEITYQELDMIKKVIDILEENRNFVLKRIKKYSVEEYRAKKKFDEEQSQKMFEALKELLIKSQEKRESEYC